MTDKPRYWLGTVELKDDFGAFIGDEFYDAVTRYHGQWAKMTRSSWERHRLHDDLGTGKGQRYARQPDGRWLKAEG